MVHSVSISSVRPVVRSRTRPDRSPITEATDAARTRPVIGSFQIPYLASMPTV